MHDGCERQFDVRLDDHFLPTCQQQRQLRDRAKCAVCCHVPTLHSHCSDDVTRRTQHHPLSASSDNPSHGYAMRVHGSMLQVIGVREPVSRLPRGDCSDQHCCPERAWCAVALSMFEYYVYSICPGQESACGGRVQPHRLAVSVLNNHDQMTHATSHCATARTQAVGAGTYCSKTQRGAGREKT